MVSQRSAGRVLEYTLVEPQMPQMVMDAYPVLHLVSFQKRSNMFPLSREEGVSEERAASGYGYSALRGCGARACGGEAYCGYRGKFVVLPLR